MIGRHLASLLKKVLVNELYWIKLSGFVQFAFADRIILQSGQVKRTPQDCINEFIIQRLNPLVVVDFSFISALLNI